VSLRWWAIVILAIPLLIGAIGTYTRCERFQRSYRNLYRYAVPDAPLRLDPVNGTAGAPVAN
jgi:hypothetical protein